MKAAELPLNSNNSKNGKSPKNPNRKQSYRNITLITRYLQPTDKQLEIISNCLFSILNTSSATLESSINFQSAEVISND